KPCSPGHGFVPSARAASRLSRNSSRTDFCTCPEARNCASVLISGEVVTVLTVVGSITGVRVPDVAWFGRLAVMDAEKEIQSTLMLLVRHGQTPTTGKILPGRAAGLNLSEH